MTHKILKGVCRGGPLDGQILAHYSDQYRIVIAPPLTLTFDRKSGDRIKLEHCRYYYILGQWIWKTEK